MAGPIEALIDLSRKKGFEEMSLSIISRTLDPISPGPIPPDETSCNFAGRHRYLPTHTLQNAPQLDVLIVPGGNGAFNPRLNGDKADIDDYLAFVQNCYRGYGEYRPLQYIISVCNGAGILAQSGILHGRRATTNKDFWTIITEYGPKTHWIARARWVNDGNIWTTSGVSAGTDGILAWMSTLLPEDLVTSVVNGMEWIRASSADHDPFAETFGCEDVPPKVVAK